MTSVFTVNGKSRITVSGLTIEYSNGKITIDGLDKKHWRKGTNDCVLDKDGTINGDVNGNIEITGNNVTIIIKGDVDGNIIGSADITVEGDIDGNIVGGRIKR